MPSDTCMRDLSVVPTAHRSVPNRASFSIRPMHATSVFHHHRATVLAKAKRILKWQRDPEGMRLRILEAAKQEFAGHGLAGARVDRIAAKAGANKRMLYSPAGKKDDLYLAVLEGPTQRSGWRSAGSPWSISTRPRRSRA